jgi:hypothetical protein
MKIVDTQQETKFLKFDEVTGGNVFYQIERGNLFMAFEYPVCSSEGEDHNAISLVNGDLVWFDCDELVCPIEAEIVLK